MILKKVQLLFCDRVLAKTKWLFIWDHIEGVGVQFEVPYIAAKIQTNDKIYRSFKIKTYLLTIYQKWDFAELLQMIFILNLH